MNMRMLIEEEQNTFSIHFTDLLPKLHCCRHMLEIMVWGVYTGHCLHPVAHFDQHD